MILDRIVEEKRKEIEKAKELFSLAELIKKSSSFIGQHRGFKDAVSQPDKINLIAEIKKASPSKGILREDFEPVEIARAYEASGACALSILTEEKFFQGSIGYLKTVREAVNLPILRKDFIIDEYQIYESVCAGADSVLLIAQLLSEEQLKEFYSLCTHLKLDAVCEVHNEEDLDKVLGQDCTIIGINNRNLQTFEEDPQVSARLIRKIPKGKAVISESGIKSFEDVKFLQSLGVNAVLIGEAFMCSKDIKVKVKELMRW
ncbi:MAG: indole-3-glycerol phosphate synthase TrpC [Candidatus Omnitrophica bacterium]|nr:indole-3-glycerol phosphate synthase TrpC [Candidatus Omnitrophota bacterium]MBU3933196.1 indole-3-glycerol phosphate synthase TrpC [Candidatus Omnitrophota bacterium]